MDNSWYDELSLIHFNDVHHITQSTALGKLSHVFRKAKAVPEAERSITVFSGDVFSPSLESAVMKGEHIVPVLNHLLVDVACYGNHDFDFGEDVLVNLSRGCTFPWLLANAVHADGRLMAAAKEHLVIEKKGYRIGFLGLAGTDWPSNCQNLPADCIILILSITHMRHEEDVYLAKSCDKDVDLILGGHDHDLAVHGAKVTAMDDTFQGNIKLIKSGTDFRSFSDVKMWLTRKNGKAFIGRIRVDQTRNITLADDLPDDNGIRDILTELQTRIADTVYRPLFHSTVPLDGRTSVVRTGETNMGNMVADAVRAYYNTDIALINSGSLRCDRIIGAGVITVKDMIGARRRPPAPAWKSDLAPAHSTPLYIDILPFDNPLVVKRLRGWIIAEALENAACDIDGRFFQVSGVTFNTDPQRPVGSHIHGVYLVPDHRCGAPAPPAPRVPLNAEGEYIVSMTAFMAEGFASDGYTVFKDTPTLVDEEGAMTDSSLLLQVFRQDIRDIDGRESSVLDRARAAIILSETVGGMPFVGPSVQGRIKYIGRTSISKTGRAKIPYKSHLPEPKAQTSLHMAITLLAALLISTTS